MHSNETISQFSTIDAILQGIYDGPATFANVRRYGDFGLGTVNHLDGEMLALDGIFYQITNDGKVHIITEDMKTSFATITYFKGEHSATLPKIAALRSLQNWLNRHLGSQNFFWSIRIHGLFPTIKVRSISRQNPPYKPLAEIIQTETIFEYTHVTGTLIGFRCPPYIKGINASGYHFHFLSDDKSKGGHVLGCSLNGAHAAWGSHKTFQMMLPNDQAFRHADFSVHDAETLQKIESDIPIPSAS